MSYSTYHNARVPAQNWSCDTCHSPLSLGDMGHRTTMGSLKLSAARGCAECTVFLRGILHVNGDETDGTDIKVSASCQFPKAIIGKERDPNLWGSKKRVTFYCLPGSSLPWKSVPFENHAPGSTSVQSAVSFTMLRLEACFTTHGSCTLELTRLPKRTVFLGESHHTVSVRESSGGYGIYTTLSYCWGDPEFHPIKTLKGSLAQHMQGITLDSLPKTFQDAIEFTRALGIENIWIDSLCIVQDDKDDCAMECSKMASIYTNSLLTISAAASADTRGGLFRTNNMKTCEIRLPANPRKKGKSKKGASSIFARPPMHSEDLQPIYQRGWIFQERMLSRRTFYFNEFELAWQCESEDVCECGQTGALQPLAWRDWDKQRDLTKDLWGYMVREYTKLELGWGADKLPAISGVADSYQSRTEAETGSSAGQFYAGLWERNFPEYLCWRVLNASKLRPRPEYRAPTWSWASIDCEVIFPTVPFPDPIFVAEVVSVNCVPSTSNSFGQVCDGWVDLKTSLLSAFLHPYMSSDYRLNNSPNPGREGDYSGTPEVSLDSLSDCQRTRREISCALIAHCDGKGRKNTPGYRSEKIYLLLLEPVSAGEDVFRRIGFVSGTDWSQPFINQLLRSPRDKKIKIV